MFRNDGLMSACRLSAYAGAGNKLNCCRREGIYLPLPFYVLRTVALVVSPYANKHTTFLHKRYSFFNLQDVDSPVFGGFRAASDYRVETVENLFYFACDDIPDVYFFTAKLQADHVPVMNMRLPERFGKVYACRYYQIVRVFRHFPVVKKERLTIFFYHFWGCF